ncbi:hypothetical protein [Nitrosospira sp. Nsp14]|uniref:hypothetical protein n=1 Tax=Nitrosospira sp. Nsp14 TaxID=1855333 RepID=UPI0035293D41
MRPRDTLVVQSMDRLAHSFEDMLRLVSEMNDLSVSGIPICYADNLSTQNGINRQYLLFVVCINLYE